MNCHRPGDSSPDTRFILSYVIFDQLDADTLANARITWRDTARDLSVALAVTKLFDRYYYTSKFDLTGAGAGAIAGSPGRPREWSIPVKKTF